MSVHVTSWVLRHSDERLGRRLVLLVLADHANDDGTGAWPSVPTQAKEARLSERQVHNCLRGLEADGAIKRDGQSRYGTTIWTVVMTPPANIAPVQSMTGKVSQIAPDSSFDPSKNVVRDANASLTRSSEKALTTKKPNKPFNALVAVCPGTDPKTDGGRIAKALKEIRQRCEAEAQADDPRGDPARAILAADEQGDPRDNEPLAQEVMRRAALYRERWPGIDLTPTALSKNWTLVATDRPGAGVTTEQILRMAKDEL